MNNLCKTKGLILRRFPLNEADELVTIMTEDYGKIGAIAKGSRRIKSKFCGRIELFYEVFITYYQGRSLANLNEIEIVNVSPALDMNLKSKSILFCISEITQKLVADSQESPEIFELLRDTLAHFDEKNSETILYAYSIKLLTLLGFMSPWDICSRSNTKLNLSEALFLSTADASVIRSGYASPTDIRLTPSVVKWINYMQKEPFSRLKIVSPSHGEKTEVWAVIQSSFGNLLNFPFKSQAFLQFAN